MKQQVKKAIAMVSKFLPMQTKLSPRAAHDILQNYSPKPIGVCSANNKVAIDYDLQIIVPCYNVEKYIRQCLDSILVQRTSYRVLISIVNDGSTDGTADILQQVLAKTTAACFNTCRKIIWMLVVIAWISPAKSGNRQCGRNDRQILYL